MGRNLSRSVWESRKWRPLRVHLALRDLARAAHRVDLVEEDDARRRRPRRREEVADAPRADADVLLVERRAARREERHARLARHRAREERLAGARLPLEEEAARHLRAEPAEALGVAQVLDHLDELGLHLVDALDVGEAVRRVRHRLVRRAPRRGAVRAEQRAERAAEATEVARRRQHAHGHPRRQHVEDATHHLERQALAERQLVLEERARDVGPARRCVLVGRRTGPRRTEDGSEEESCKKHLDLDVSPATAGRGVVSPKV